jgi:excinuclease ABC subunit C
VKAIAPKVFEKLAEVPHEPGVYEMKSASGRIIYIGKAKALRNRVSSYFHDPGPFDRRIAQMVSEIADFDYIITPSEIDALVLEATLIKQFKPRYNVSLKDDKTYPYVKLTVNEPYPRLFVTRRILTDGAKYYGPYSDVGSLRKTLRYIAGMFNIRTCSLDLDGHKFYPKPCLDYHLELCSGPCADLIPREEYVDVVKGALDFFNGKYDRVVGEFRKRMQEASVKQDYERAARFRDLYFAAERMLARQKVMLDSDTNYDLVGIARAPTVALAIVMPIRHGRMTGERTFTLSNKLDEGEQAVLTAFLELFYSNPDNVPPAIVIPAEMEDAPVYEEWLSRLRGSRVRLVVPRRGERAQLLKIATTNAAERLRLQVLRKAGEFVVTPAIAELQRVLGLDTPPRSVEGYDVSNISGTNAVASAVVFIDGRKATRDYRSFNIKTTDTPDDYTMIREALRRRFSRAATDPKWPPLPDVILIDGGHGHLAIALDAHREAVEEVRRRVEGREKEFDAGPGGLGENVSAYDQSERDSQAESVLDGLEKVTVISLSKGEETVFRLRGGKIVPLVLDRRSPALKLLQQVRDEAHRLCNVRHRRRRAKAMVRSELDALPGIGPERRKALVRHFKSVAALKEARVEDIAEVPGFGMKTAAKILVALNKATGEANGSGGAGGGNQLW